LFRQVFRYSLWRSLFTGPWAEHLSGGKADELQQACAVQHTVDARSGLVHTVVGTAANVNDLNVAGELLHGDEEAAFGDAGYQGVHKRPEAEGPAWHVAMRPGKRKKLNPFIEPEFVAERVEKMKASIRAKVEHPFRVIKRPKASTWLRTSGRMSGGGMPSIQTLPAPSVTMSRNVVSASAGRYPTKLKRRLPGSTALFLPATGYCS
jgi:hypothetical protein